MLRGRLLAADVLLAGLQRQAIGRLRRANRPTGRRCGRAASASAHRAPPCRRRAGRHSPSARRSAAPSRWRCRRRVRRARPAASAPAGRPRSTASAPLAFSAAIAGAQVAHRAGRARILQQRAEHVGRVEIGQRDRRRPASSRAARRGCAARRASADALRDRRRRLWSSTCDARSASAMASAAAVASSSSEALATSSPVRSQIMVWKLNSASSRPWLISG